MLSFALISSILSSICMALMVTFDRLMVGDCYQSRSNHAWFVSSAAGCVFGLTLTACVWIGSVLTGHTESFQVLFTTVAGFLDGTGLLMILAGALGVQILLHYFRCFAEDAQSAAVAAWLSATPVFIFLGLILLFSIQGEGLHTLMQPVWIVGVVLATVGLVAFEQLSSKGGFIVNGVYRKELGLMLFFNVVYVLVLKELLTSPTGDPLSNTEILALLPFYWIGFAAGIRVIFKKGEWRSFKDNWKDRIHYFLIPILIVEVIGMLVFYFEYFGLTELDPVYVNIIIGAHIFLVYLLDLLLGRVRLWMEATNMHILEIGGVRLLREHLPSPKVSHNQIIFELCAIAITVAGIVLISFYSL